MVLDLKGQRGSNKQVPALPFSKAQVYDFPYLSSHTAVVRPLGEGKKGEGLNFTRPNNPSLLDSKTPGPDNFREVSI
jgi:hypothetical protein